MKQNIWPQYLKEKNNRKTTFAFLQFTYALNNKIMLFEKSHTILKRMIITYSLRNWNHFPLLLLYNQYFHARVQLKSYCLTDNAGIIHGHLNQDYSSRSRVFLLKQHFTLRMSPTVSTGVIAVVHFSMLHRYRK